MKTWGRWEVVCAQVAGWMLLALFAVAALAGCDPPAPATKPVLTKVTAPSPPPPEPPPAAPQYSFLEEEAAKSGLRSAFSVTVTFDQKPSWAHYLQLAEIILPALEPDGKRVESKLESAPVEAVRVWLSIPETSDPDFRPCADQVLQAITARLWEDVMRRGISRGQMTAEQLHGQLEAQTQQWNLEPAQRAAVVDWMSSAIYRSYTQTLPSGTQVDIVDLSQASYSADARRAAVNQHVQSAWERLREGMNKLLPQSEPNAGVDLRFRLAGDPADAATQLALELVNRAGGEKSPCIVEYTLTSPGVAAQPAEDGSPEQQPAGDGSPEQQPAEAGHASQQPARIIVRELPAVLQKETARNLTSAPSVEANLWEAAARQELREEFHIGRFASLPPLRRDAAEPVTLTHLLISPDEQQPWQVELRAGKSSDKNEVLFGVRPAPNRDNGWLVLMKSQNTPPQGAPAALLEVQDDRLIFTWNPKAHDDARLLASSVIDIRAGGRTQRLHLWTPVALEPLQIDMTKAEDVLPVALEKVADKKLLKLHTVRLDDSQLQVAGDASFNAWIDLEFPEVPNAVLRVRLAEPKNSPLSIEFKPVLTYRGEEGELTVDALTKMQARNNEIVNTLPPKILASKKFILLLQDRIRLAGGNRAAAIKFEVALRDEIKKHDGLVQAMTNATERLAWALHAGELLQHLHGKTLHYIITAGDEKTPQVMASSDQNDLTSLPLVLEDSGT